MPELPPVDRRQLLQLAAAAAGTLWLPRSAFGQPQPRWTAQPFALGVASGSPATDSVVLWTRLAPERGGLPDGGRQPILVRWEIADDEAFAHIVARGDTMALPQLGHSVHVEPQGLVPDRWYFFRFHSGDATSPTGRTRTLPLPDAMPARLRLAYASCQRWEHGYYAAWRHMQAEGLDFVVFLGDYIYEYPNATAAARSFPTLGWTKTLPEYRDRYALHRSDPNLQAMHAACPWLVTWDDHEVQNDYAGEHSGDARPLGLNYVADFGARRAAAYQAFYEHMPVRASSFARALTAGAPGGELRLYNRYAFGRLADVMVLDDRQYRDRQACSPEGGGAGLVDAALCDQLRDPARTLLGAAQEQWLDGALSQATRTWTVIGQETVFGRRDFRPGPGEAFASDGWDGYPAARSRLTDGLQRHRVANPVFLGGDVHEHWAGHVLADYTRPGSDVLGVEFCGTSITSRPGPVERLPMRLAENPHFVFADGAHRGYGVAEFTPVRLTVQLRGLDDVSRPDAQLKTLARFQVEAGQRRLERV